MRAGLIGWFITNRAKKNAVHCPPPPAQVYTLTHSQLFNGGEGRRLKVGFQPLKIISPTARWIRYCMQVYVGAGVGSDFGPVFKSTGGEQMRITLTTILNRRRPVGSLGQRRAEKAKPPFLHRYLNNCRSNHDLPCLEWMLKPLCYWGGHQFFNGVYYPDAHYTVML